MAKDRIERAELADRLLKRAEDPLRAMAEMIADFVMEAEVSEKLSAWPHGIVANLYKPESPT